uniref:Protein TsetseEP domain-containing protein n=1 Tax=Anopheles christyi TaxID=43041 RepID=A0A182JTS1_9DIPT
MQQSDRTGAKPDFGVDVMIRGSGAVQGTAVLIEQQFIELTGHMSFSLVSSYGLLSELRTQMDLLARNVSSIGTAFATALNIASTSSSNVSATFEPMVLALSSLQTLQVDHLPAILAEIQSLVELPIKLELQDSFRAIFSTVQLLAGTVLQLTSAVVNSNDPANVDVSVVNMVNRAASLLRANIVPLNYTIASTGDNIRAVDAFLARLSSSVQSNTVTVGNDFERFLQQQYQLKNTTTAGLSCTKQEISDIGSSVAPFLPILCDGSDPCDLQTTVEQIMQLQSDEVDQVATTMTRQIDELARFKPVYTAAASELFNRTYNLGLFLADVTVIKGPYALHCFKKYSNLVEQLIPRVTDGFNVCYRQETTRLRSLRTSLLNIKVKN